ncbi:hypothetical protein [Spiroplasma clarkii]|uniref:Uncharacterized protein n=1 Tax=Spiroplasma clarkii TaxID=2139 RepID=A0A2K8KMS6_9MOLU|nr:hypothetical protein [Spiroplasma clarkii]ATX70894.1 hypothetical protein SCLAR_v1c05750 [Spiroplasma clarkii]
MKQGDQKPLREVKILKKIKKQIELDSLETMGVEQEQLVETFLKKVSSITKNGEKVNFNFAYLYLEAKIIRNCGECQNNYYNELQTNLSDEQLINLLTTSQNITHCLNCNNHQVPNHKCNWCYQTMCNSCCPNYLIKN